MLWATVPSAMLCPSFLPILLQFSSILEQSLLFFTQLGQDLLVTLLLGFG
jgi:hypothetical protein